jgi:hypothetical protein
LVIDGGVPRTTREQEILLLCWAVAVVAEAAVVVTKLPIVTILLREQIRDFFASYGRLYQHQQQHHSTKFPCHLLQN